MYAIRSYYALIKVFLLNGIFSFPTLLYKPVRMFATISKNNMPSSFKIIVISIPPFYSKAVLTLFIFALSSLH